MGSDKIGSYLDYTVAGLIHKTMLIYAIHISTATNTTASATSAITATFTTSAATATISNT